MRALWFLLASVVLLSAAPAASSQPPGPAQPVLIPPQIFQVEEWSKDKQIVTLSTVQVIYMHATKVIVEKIVENGVEKTVPVTIMVTAPVAKKFVVKWLAKVLKATDVDGKPLSNEEMVKRLQPGTTVLVLFQSTNQKLAPAHQRLFGKDAVIILAPEADPPKLPPPVNGQ